jgi:hypothetical protein
MLREFLPHVGMVVATAAGVYLFQWSLKHFPIV